LRRWEVNLDNIFIKMLMEKVKVEERKENFS
jgi:hypothetical protein